MPVTVKHSMNGLAAIKKIGIPQMLYDWLHASDVEVKLKPTQFEFIVPKADGNAIYTVPVSLTQLQKLNAGTLSVAEVAMLQKLIGEAIKAIMATKAVMAAQAIDPDAFPAPAAPLTLADAGALAALPPLKTSKPDTSAPAVNAQATAGKWEMFDLTQLKTAPMVKLRDATRMYQPVNGTSAQSRYFLVAGSDDIRVAARYKASTLSVRIEGPKFDKHINAIKKSGVEYKNSKDYASLHLTVEDDVVAAKALGAILLGLGVPLETTLPNVNIIKGI